MLQKPRELLMLGALLHDIGKISQRANNNPKSESHLKFGFNFLKDKITYDFGEETEIVCRFPLGHHEPLKLKELDQESNNYIKDNINEIIYLNKIVEKADKLSAGERISDEESKYENIEDPNITVPLKSVISEIKLSFRQETNSNKIYFDVNEINYETVVPKTNEDILQKNQENLIQNYKLIEQKISNSLTKIKENDFKKYYSKVEATLLKYTKLIPSSTYKTEPDISFYDHSKTTSAIAISIYDYLEEKGIKTLQEDKKTFNKDYHYFILLRGELSGIQKYIYYTFDSSKTIKGSAKRLRAKSFKLILLLDSITTKIVEDLNLSTSNILLNGGGSFEILLPNTKKIKDYLENFEAIIQKIIKEQFGNQIYLTLVWEECTSEDLAINKNSLKNYKKTRERIAKKLEQKKNQPYHKIIDYKFFNISTKENNLINYKIEEVCSSCGLNKKFLNINETNNEENELCKNCYEELSFGSNLLKKNKLYKNLEKGIKIGFHNYSFEQISNQYYEIELYGEKEKSDTVSDQILFVGNYAYETDNKIAEFEKLAEGYGVKRIALIKGDVDYLGEIFVNGLSEDKYSISRVNTLSTMLNLFFAYKINQIVKNNKTGKSYILYSGGDDFVIISNWAESIHLIREINNKFKEFCSYNPNFTISTGNFIFKPKFPLIRAVSYAEELLEKSKKNEKRNFNNEDIYEKDSVTIFGCTTRTKNYEEQVLFAEYLNNLFENDKISSGTLYSIIREWNLSFSKIKSNIDKKTIKRHIPMIYYLFKRNIKNKNLREELLQKLFVENLFDDVIIAASYVNLINREEK